MKTLLLACMILILGSCNSPELLNDDEIESIALEFLPRSTGQPIVLDEEFCSRYLSSFMSAVNAYTVDTDINKCANFEGQYLVNLHLNSGEVLSISIKNRTQFLIEGEAAIYSSSSVLELLRIMVIEYLTAPASRSSIGHS